MIDTSKYKKMFVDETFENITSIIETLEALERDGSDKDAVQTLFRSFHSIKGMAASMDYLQIQEVSHKLEDLLDGLRSGKIGYSQKISDIIYDGAGLIEKMVRIVDDDSDEKTDEAPLMERLISVSAAAPPPSDAHPSVSPEEKETASPEKKETADEVLLPDLADLSKGEKYQYKIWVAISKESISPPARALLLVETLKSKSGILKTIPTLSEIEEGNMDCEFTVYVGTDLSRDKIKSLISSSVEIEKFSVTKIEVAQEKQTDEPDKKEKQTGEPDKEPVRATATLDKGKVIQYHKPGAVKVDTPVLDSLIDIAGEMFIQENQLRNIARTLKSSETIESVNKLEKLVRKLYKEVMMLRMVPISLLTDIIPRVLREVLRNSDKKVDLVISGKEIKLDRSIIEKLGDPMIHLIRNSIDHGIEPVKERAQAGKPESARIAFTATKERDSIKIEISDDGRGLNPEKIKEKIIAKGLSTRKNIEKADVSEIYNYIWQPDFSTADKVTSISGRGVGMDIVKNVVEGLGGNVSVTSTPGKGCKFHLQVPLTIAIIKTFRIKLDSDIYAIPIGKILHTIDVPRDDFKTDDEGMYFDYRDEKIPVDDLKTMLQYGTNGLNGKKMISILILEARMGGYNKIGLIVDSFISIYDTVIKSLGKPLDKFEIFSGSTMSEKGELVLILDVDKLLHLQTR